MGKLCSVLVAGLSVVGVTTPTFAQTSSSTEASNNQDVSALEEIIVTARRREESVQEVPQTVNVVTAEQIDKLNIRDFSEIQTLVPGLTMSSGNAFATSATVRGVAFNPEASGNNPTVEFYLNDTPIASNFLFQSMFDVGQFELSRGPQGTLRGRASPSGSITVSTRRPDLSDYGVVANATVTDTETYKYDGAVNIPIIKEMLAVRLAAVSDDNEGTRVETTKRGTDPAHNREAFRDTEALRASLRFEPFDWFALNFMYQTLSQDNVLYSQVQSSTLVTGEPLSGTLIRPYDLKAIEDQGAINRQDQDVYIWNADFRFAGQRLSYSGNSNVQDFGVLAASDTGDYFAPPRFAVAERTFRDPTGYQQVCQEQGSDVDLVPTNQAYYQCTHSRAIRKSHELRLASEERIADIFDYVVGVFYDHNDNPSRLTQETPLLVAPTTLATVNLTAIERDGDSTEKSGFANVTAHIGDALELSGGMRYIDYENFSSLKVGGSRPTPDTNDTFDTTVYMGSVKYHFNDDMMVYGTVGTSWRPGVRVIGNFSANLTPRELGFINLPPEESTSYELGFKSSFLDARGRFNLSVYHQEFDNYVYRGNLVYFVNYRALTPTIVVPEVATFNFVSGAPAEVDGVEAEASFQITPRWSVSGNVSYADGQIDNATIACTDLNGDGVADTNVPRPTLAQLQAAVGPGQNVSQCGFSGRASFAPKWGANLQSEVDFTLTKQMDAFVRGLITYTPSNAQDPINTFDNVDSYPLLNLYTGLRDPEGRWEVTLFAKNLLDEEVILNSGSAPVSTGLTTLLFGPGGQPIGSSSSQFSSPYYTVNVLPEREVGINLRIAFGAR